MQLVPRGRQVGQRALELAGAQPQLEHVHHPVGQGGERVVLLGAHRARRGVEDAQGADRDAGGGDQPAGGVEPDQADLAGDERVGREALVQPGVGHDHRPAGVQHRVAHGVLAGADAGLEADRGQLVLLEVTDQVDRRGGHLADLCRQLDQGLQVPARGSCERPVAVDRRDPAGVRGAVPRCPVRRQRVRRSVAHVVQLPCVQRSGRSARPLRRRRTRPGGRS